MTSLRFIHNDYVEKELLKKENKRQGRKRAAEETAEEKEQRKQRKAEEKEQEKQRKAEKINRQKAMTAEEKKQRKKAEEKERIKAIEAKEEDEFPYIDDLPMEALKGKHIFIDPGKRWSHRGSPKANYRFFSKKVEGHFLFWFSGFKKNPIPNFSLFFYKSNNNTIGKKAKKI